MYLTRFRFSLRERTRSFRYRRLQKGQDSGITEDVSSGSGIINLCYCLHFPELPLRGNCDETKYSVEVKSTNGRSKSLRMLIESEKYPDISYGIKFTSGNIGYSDKIYSFPYFCAFLLKRYLKSTTPSFCKQKETIHNRT